MIITRIFLIYSILHAAWANQDAEVFLGGSCNPTTWRRDIVVPKLQSLGISFYNPQVDNWTPDLVEKERIAKENAKVLLFVIDGQTRNVASMIEVAQLAKTRSNTLVIVIIPSREDDQLFINNELITKSEITELSPITMCREITELDGALEILIAILNENKIPIHESFESAIENIYKLLRKRLALKFTPQFDKKDREIVQLFNQLSIGNENDAIPVDETLKQLQKLSQCTQPIAQLKDFTDYIELSQNQLSYLEFKGLYIQYILMRKSNDRITCENLLRNIIDNFIIRQNYLGVYSRNDKMTFQKFENIMSVSNISYHQIGDSGFIANTLGLEILRMKNSRKIWLSIALDSRAINSMIISAYVTRHNELKSKVTLSLENLCQKCEVLGEQLTRTATRDYNRGRKYLEDLANQAGIPVLKSTEDIFNSILKLK